VVRLTLHKVTRHLVLNVEITNDTRQDKYL